MREETIRLGLNLPLFVAALVSLGTGTLVGMLGIWGAAAWGRPVPEWEKVGHAHASWWAVLIMIASMVLPSLQLKPWAKKLIIAGTFAGPTLWVGVLASYYEIGGPKIWRFEAITAPGSYYEIPLLGLLAGIFEFLGLLALGAVALSASGVKIPIISSKEPPPRSKYEFISDIEVPRKIFLLPTVMVIISVIIGFAITTTFKITHSPISPAALVQLHDHIALIATSAVIALLTLRILGVGEKIFNLGYRLMQIALPLLLVGLLAFTFGGFHSIVWVAPAGIYYLLLLIALSACIGFFIARGRTDPTHTPLRTALAVCFVGLAILVPVGAYIALVWDTNPNITVTYKQPAGEPYPGPYPKQYMGTAPVVGTPRGLENAHLSPGSWFHVAITWLLILILVGNQLFTGLINKPGMIYLYAVTIPMAPLFNMLGRFLAWLGIPNGIGALWFAGHPLKGFNLISLFIVALIAIYILSKKHHSE
ncbi:hypothetical protein ATG_15120 [Desulfurococcaceae archaeon AG1]|nr:hypothetical protein ATG_15120 [Desulfurococcaceae archaeon AG1]